MRYNNQKRGKNFWIKRVVFIPLAIAAGVIIFGGIVMFLWNAILPAVFGVGTISFWQALGILILSKILFSSFRGGHRNSWGRGREWRNKWMNLSPEEKEKMKAEWKERCRPSTTMQESQ